MRGEGRRRKIALKFWVGLGYLLGVHLGVGSTGVWMAMAIGNVVTGLIALAWIKYGNWVKPVIGERRMPGKQRLHPPRDYRGASRPHPQPH